MLQEFLFIFVDNCVPRLYWINNVHYNYIGKLLIWKLDSSNQSSWIGSYTMHPCTKYGRQKTKIGFMQRLLNTTIFIICLNEKLWFENIIYIYIFFYIDSPLKLLVLCTNHFNSHYSYERNRIFSPFYSKWRNFILCLIF